MKYKKRIARLENRRKEFDAMPTKRGQNRPGSLKK